jgi:hypothetical protein
MDIEDVTDWNMDNFEDFNGSITLTN